MTTITFDTLKFVERLRAAGVPEAHAKAEAEALVEVFEVTSGDLATKSDLREVELRLEAKIDRATSELKVDLMKWVTGALIAQAAVIATLVKLL